MLYNIPTITTTQLIEWIVEAATFGGFGMDGDSNGFSLIAYGEAGCGKTYAGKAAADKLGYQFATLFAMHYSPADVAGIRTINMDAAAESLKHYMPDWMARLDPNKPAIICVDEVTKALMATNNALMGGVHERMIGNQPLPKGWFFYMTGNLASAKAGDRDLSSPMRNKVAQVIVRNTERDWLRNHAFPCNLDYRVTSFVQFHADGHDAMFPHGVLNTWDADEQPAAFSSERSLDNVAKILAAGGDVKRWGCALLGNTVGNALIEHCEVLDQLPSVDDIRHDPSGCDVPTAQLIGHYAGNMLAYHATPADMPAFYTYLKRFPSEVTVTAMTEITRRHPECKETAEYIAFKREYRMTV